MVKLTRPTRTQQLPDLLTIEIEQLGEPFEFQAAHPQRRYLQGYYRMHETRQCRKASLEALLRLRAVHEGTPCFWRPATDKLEKASNVYHKSGA